MMLILHLPSNNNNNNNNNNNSCAALSAGAAAEMAAKTSQVRRIIRVVRVAADCFGNFWAQTINESAVQFLNDLAHRITSVSIDDKDGQFRFQRLPVALQRFTAVLLHESFGSDVDPDLYPTSFFNLLSF